MKIIILLINLIICKEEEDEIRRVRMVDPESLKKFINLEKEKMEKAKYVMTHSV